MKSPKNRFLEPNGTGKSTKNSVEVIQWTLISLILTKFQTLVFKNIFSISTFRVVARRKTHGCTQFLSWLQKVAKRKQQTVTSEFVYKGQECRSDPVRAVLYSVLGYTIQSYFIFESCKIVSFSCLSLKFSWNVYSTSH